MCYSGAPFVGRRVKQVESGVAFGSPVRDGLDKKSGSHSSQKAR
jgi:hypothetical protein